MKVADYRLDDIEVGSVHEFMRIISEKEVDEFAALTGDFNPLHVDNSYAGSTRFGKRVSHGMLSASLFSTLIGMICPGKRSLYLSQTLNFREPVFPGSSLIIRGTVTSKAEGLQIITMKTQIINGGRIAIDGEAKVKLL